MPDTSAILNEFRVALREEINAARRASSSSAVPLNNGHKISESAGEFQYAFLLESVLNLPDGTPCNLIVPERPPIEAAIVSSEGLRLVLSLKNNLDKFVPSARLQTDLTILMQKLIERIDKNETVQNHAAERMLGLAPVSGHRAMVRGVSNLNAGQLEALQGALGRNLTVIWGPPGTGKTHTIGTIAEHLFKEDRSVLLVSHTNIAVDQAIRHVAGSLKDQLAIGVVVRVGAVKDEALKSDFPDVLITTQIERRSRELVAERDRLAEVKQTHANSIAEAEQAIDVIEWLQEAPGTIVSILKKIDEIEKLEKVSQTTRSEFEQLRQQYSTLIDLKLRVFQILTLKQTALSQINEASIKKMELQSLAAERENYAKKLREHDARIEIAQRLAPLRNELTTHPPLDAQRSTIETLSKRLVGCREALGNAQSELESARDLLSEIQSSNVLSRVFRRLPKLEAQQVQVSSLLGKVTSLGAELAATKQAFESATAKLARIIEIDGELSRNKEIGSPAQEQGLKAETEGKVRQNAVSSSKITQQLSVIESEILKNQAEIAQRSISLNGEAESIYQEVCNKLDRFNKVEELLKSSEERMARLHTDVKSALSLLYSSVQTWISEIPDLAGLEKSLRSIQIIHERLTKRYSGVDVPSLLKKIDQLRNDISQINARISEIETKLTEIEKDIIAGAMVLGATLTKAYLSDIIQSRKFDTVILDEASMAPIPALWAAALLSERNLIIVGDFKQLPPIVLSKHEMSKKWLGQDIFHASGLVDKYNRGSLPPHFTSLLEQRRMLPEIAKIANLFYDDQLENAFTKPTQYKDFSSFTEWYAKEWPYDNPVVLIDTGSLHAWVTSVVKGGNTSRLNFLSATVAVDLAEQLFSPGTNKRKGGESKRILIVSPYRAHAKLVSLLISDVPALQDDVVAGTAHSFQGSEADVVIFDTVVDEPHFRVNLFTPALDDQIKCLLNVALTRAKFRLFVVGDFDYCLRKGRNAFLGRELIPKLLEKKFPRVDAREILPNGLAARAARTQMRMLGGQIVPDHDRIVVTQADFYRLLATDLEKAQKRVIVYSPFMTTDRVSFLLPQLQAALDAGVEVVVITKDRSERSRRELPEILKIENQFSEIGVRVMHKLRMHEKLVFIDDDIAWSGSLNPLSFSSTQEIMERRKNRKILSDYFQILRLNDLLQIQGRPESQCPICGNEMIAAEGKDQPYYWRCSQAECFTRGIDQPYPLDGKFTCGTCNAPVEFGYWGPEPHWRCTENPRHRQKIFKSHLRLPRMAALVPVSERSKICEIFNLTNFEQLPVDHARGIMTRPVQRNLF
jgi:Cdc6-like AAA superfamily ATPase